MSENRGSRQVTIAGGGIAAMEAILALRTLAPWVEIELVAPRSAFEYPPLAVFEPFGVVRGSALGLAHFAEEQGVAVVHDTLAGVDPDRRTIATARGAERSYDVLLVATGAVAVDGVPGATSFRGSRDRERVRHLLDGGAQGTIRKLAFAVPAGVAWTLPIYELALLTATEGKAHDKQGLEITVVTPEAAPLELFGPRASAAAAELLDNVGVSAYTSTYPERFEDGVLWTRPRDAHQFDAVVALPRRIGPRFRGLPADRGGFIPTERFGKVAGIEDVYAVGDATAFPIKQGGIACQQADAAVAAIAASAGADVEPEPFKPFLRGLLMTGVTARYLELGIAGGHGDGSEPRLTLWEPSSKVFGHYLLPYLRERSSHDRARPAA